MFSEVTIVLTIGLSYVHVHVLGDTPFDVRVNTPMGQYQGSTPYKSVLGKTIFSFRGIRYAEAPINNLRFKPPVPVKRHEGVYDATEEGPACPYPTHDATSEDCLMLNVHTTELPRENQNSKRPVILFIHPGGFYKFSGRSNWAGPQYLLTQDIVFVSINYRIGSLGFISTGDKEAPGNNGLKDQVAAMKWVKANIGAFGGDPNSITLFGYSAGGISATLHLVSSMSQGLFHKVIISEVSALGQIPLGRNQLDVTKRQARLVGCPDDNSINIMNCLKKKSADAIGNSSFRMFEFGHDPVIYIKPVIEEDYGQERFLTDHPIKLVSEGKFQKVPILSGVTANGFVERVIETTTNQQQLQELDTHWEKYAAIVFMYERDSARSKAISKGLRLFYFGDKKLNNVSLSQMLKIYSDGQSGGFSINRGVKVLSEKNTESVFYYKFSYKGRNSIFYLQGSNETVPLGAFSHDDLMYLFHISALFPKIEKTDPEFRVMQKMTTMWANFARIGKPIEDTCGKLDYAKWEPFNCNTQKYMDIGDTLQMRERLYADRYEVWEKLIPVSQYNKIEDISY